MLSIRLLLPAVTALLFLYACTKEDLPQAGGERLYKIVSNAQDSMFYVTFFYDNEGRLAAFEDSNSQTHFGRHNIFYNKQDKMVKREWKHYFGSQNHLTGEGIDSFVYDQNNRLTKRLYGSLQTGSTTFKIGNTYSYDAQGRLVADTGHSFWSNEVAGITRYTYDGNDNIVQAEYLDYSGGVLRSSRVTTMSYTSQQNPYQSLGLAAYLFLYDEEWLLSKHAPLQKVYWDNSTVSYSYELYSNGLPKKVVDEYNQPNWSAKRTTEFFYQ